MNATGAGGAGCGFAQNGNLVWADFSLVLNDIKAKTIVETDLNGVLVTSHVMDTFIYGMQGITFDGDRGVYYISSHDLLNNEELIYTVNSSWVVTATEDPEDMSIEQEGLEYYSPYLYVSEINSKPRFKELPNTQVNSAVEEYGFTYTIPIVATPQADLVVVLDELSFPVGALTGDNKFLGNGANLRAYTSSSKSQQLPVDIIYFTTGVNAKLKIKIKLPLAETAATIFITADITATEKVADDAAYGANEVNTQANGTVPFNHPNFSIPDRSGVNAGLTVNGDPDVTQEGLKLQTFKSLSQPDSNQLEGRPEFYVHFKGNTGTLVNGTGASPHRILDKNGGVLAVGFTTTQLRIWNQGWTDIPLSLGNNVDIDFWLTYNGSTYKAYLSGVEVATVNKSQVTGSGSGSLVVGASDLVGGNQWPGRMELFEYGYSVITPERIAIEYDNTSSPSTWGSSSDWSLPNSGVTIPKESRATYQGVTEYLRTQGFTGTPNDIIVKWLISEGILGSQFNDLFSDYWEQEGFTGAYNDKWEQWRDS